MIRALLRQSAPVALLGLLAGCSDGTATVSGTVTYNDEPVKNGYVTFSPADGKGPVAGAQIADGKYTATKVAPGPKVVLVEAADKPVASIQSQGDLEKLPKELRAKMGPDGVIRADTIPPTAEGNNRKVDVVPGPQTIDLPLKRPAKK